VRRRHESRISKRSRVVLGASLGSCVGQSLRAARTSFEITFERCVFSFFYCVPQRIPCFSANPETATFRIHVRCLLLRLLPFITSSKYTKQKQQLEGQGRVGDRYSSYILTEIIIYPACHLPFLSQNLRRMSLAIQLLPLTQRAPGPSP